MLEMQFNQFSILSVNICYIQFIYSFRVVVCDIVVDGGECVCV